MTSPATASSRRSFPSRQVFPAVTAVLLVISVAAWWPVLLRQGFGPLTGPQLAGAIGLVIAFVVSEVFPLRVEIRRETLLVSLSELPLVLGLLTLPAWVVCTAHLAAGLLVYTARRDSWRNCLLNLSLILVEAGIAAFMLVVLMADVRPFGLPYLAVALGVLLGALVSAVAVGCAYHLLGPAEPMSRLIGRSMLAATAIVVFALVGVTLWRAGPIGPWLVGAMTLILLAVYRTYFTFLRQHADLARMYSFGRQLTAIGGSSEDWRRVVDEVRDLLNAKVAVLQLTDAGLTPGELAVSADETDAPLVGADDAVLAIARRSGRALVAADRTSDPVLLAALTERRAWDVIAVPLRTGDRTLALLEVRDRRSRWGRFREDDVRLLETLAGHIATALDNERLLGTLRHEAYHDSITGLLNRSGLTSEAASALAEGHLGAVLLVQLGVVHQVTSAVGNTSGDQLLNATARRLTALVDGRPAGRIDGDRFAVLIEPIACDDEMTSVVGRIATALARPYSLGGIEVEPNVAAGMAVVGSARPGGPAGTQERPERSGRDEQLQSQAGALLQQAEMALLASRPGSATVQTYRDSLGEAFRRRFQLVTQFRQAVKAGRIVVYYQPKLTLATREVNGVEALVRWMHPEFGLVSPGEFVEAIEATGSIDILLFHVLDDVLAQVRTWSERGLALGASVNLSVRNLLAPDFPAAVAAALARHGVPAELLTLEITESNVMAEPERCLPVLRDLHQLGIRLSVDDFGTGYSSLAYLRRLPIDEIKIDKSFVQGMVTDLGDLAIVRAIIDLGHSLGLTVVAEGVEEEAARDAIASMRCDGVQGFLLSRPLPLDRFEAWVASRTDKGSTRGSRVLRTIG